MKTAKLEIQNTNGEILHEDNLIIESGDKLIVQVPHDSTMQSIERIYDNIRMVMENEGINTVVLPESVNLKVLKIK